MSHRSVLNASPSRAAADRSNARCDKHERGGMARHEQGMPACRASSSSTPDRQNPAGPTGRSPRDDGGGDWVVTSSSGGTEFFEITGVTHLIASDYEFV